MAVAHDAVSESHTSTTASVSEASFSWTHTPVGTPKGVFVVVYTMGSTTDHVTSVTYNGVTMARTSGGAASVSAGDEPGRADLFELGSSVPAGAQTVVVTRTNDAIEMYANAVTVTAGADTEVYSAGIVLVQANSTLAEQNVTDGSTGVDSLRYAAAYLGYSAPPGPGTNSTSLAGSANIDVGNYGARIVRETTAGQGSRPVGFTAGTTDDIAAIHWAVREVVATGLSITSVDTDNAVLAGQSQATFAGTGLASTAKFAVKRGSAIAYGADISLSGSTGGSFTAPTMTAMFSAGVRFGDVAFYAAETSGTAIASISGSITTATNWKYVNVTDLSATGSMGSLFYGNAVSLSDQVAYSSVTTRFRWPVTVSGDGYFTVNSSGSQAGDEFAYRIWDETDSTWGTEGTIEVNGGISSAKQVYAAGSLVQASLESSTLEGATLQ